MSYDVLFRLFRTLSDMTQRVFDFDFVQAVLSLLKAVWRDENIARNERLQDDSEQKENSKSKKEDGKSKGEDQSSDKREDEYK